MMKKYRSILMATALTIALLMVSGCDFFRKVAGRPTSSELDEIRTEIEIEKKQAEAAALAAKVAEEAAAAKAAAEYDPELGLLHKYCVVVGSFSVAQNAEKIMQKLTEAGYKVFTFPFKGLTAVGVNPTDSLDEINASFSELKAESGLPKDIFIMTNK